MRWTRQRPLRMSESQGGPWPVSDRRRGRREAMFAYGKTVWSWRPWLASSRRRCCEARPGAQHRQFAGDGGKRNSSPGRARHKPSNHCAGNAGLLRLYLYARVRTSLHLLHARPRVQQAPGIPCALFFWATRICKARAKTRRGNTEVCVCVGWVERSETHRHARRR